MFAQLTPARAHPSPAGAGACGTSLPRPARLTDDRHALAPVPVQAEAALERLALYSLQLGESTAAG